VIWPPTCQTCLVLSLLVNLLGLAWLLAGFWLQRRDGDAS